MVHLTEDELVLYRYQESPDAAAVERHLSACPRCQADYASLERVLGVLDVEVPEPHLSYERDVWVRLQPRLQEAPARSWTSWLVPQLALAATVALLLAGSFALDRVVHTPPASPPHVPSVARSGAGATMTTAPDGARARVLFAAVGDHLQRSELMLTELNNTETEGKADWSEERVWAEDLVSENRLYRQSAADAGDAQVLGLLDDLERVLLEVAHTPATPHAGELERLRERLDTQDLLFKVRVTGAGLRARGEMAAVLDPPLGHTGPGL